MKKVFTAILALLYLCSATGASLEMHYCMGKLANWSLTHQSSKTCHKCGMEKKAGKGKGCCKDEQKFVQAGLDQKITENNLQLLQQLSTANLSTSFVDLPVLQFCSITEESPFIKGPPRVPDLPVYLRNCSFLI